MVDTLLAIVSSEPIPPRRLRPELPASLEATILHALAKSTQARLSSAVALRNALDAPVCENRSGGRGERSKAAGQPPNDTLAIRRTAAGTCHSLRIASSAECQIADRHGTGWNRQDPACRRTGFAVSGDFADGVIFVALETVRQPDHVLFEITKALQLREEDTRTARQALADHLSHRQLLLVLDNFEHVLEAAPLLAHLLAASSLLKIVVTSRSLLRLRGEHHFAVPPLPSTGETLVEASGLHCSWTARDWSDLISRAPRRPSR